MGIYHSRLHPPPHNGPGTEEDSLASCIHLQPQVPKQDLVKLTTLDGKILRFECRCANGQVEDEDRKFIIGYFCANDTGRLGVETAEQWICRRQVRRTWQEEKPIHRDMVPASRFLRRRICCYQLHAHGCHKSG